MFFQKQRIVLNIFFSCRGCGGYACSSPSLLLKQQQFREFRVEILCFLFQDDLLQFPHSCGGQPSQGPLDWGGLLRQASMIPWTPWVSTAFVVGVTVEHGELVFRVCCMALVLKQI